MRDARDDLRRSAIRSRDVERTWIADVGALNDRDAIGREEGGRMGGIVRARSCLVDVSARAVENTERTKPEERYMFALACKFIRACGVN